MEDVPSRVVQTPPEIEQDAAALSPPHLDEEKRAGPEERDEQQRSSTRDQDAAMAKPLSPHPASRALRRITRRSPSS